jgi:hypothetical protein
MVTARIAVISMDSTEGSTYQPDITGLLPRYRVRNQLSKTRMSEVFHADDTELGREVALKVIGPEYLRQPGFAARFKRESDIARTLKHPNIVEVYQAGRLPGDQLGYLVMRFVKGANLRKVLDERGRISLGEAVAIARQVGAALDTAHASGLIHRDVKPANILVENDTKRVFLCDFGIAKNVEWTAVTVEGVPIGTPQYWSPEQAGGGEVDHRTDVYSLGCVLYDCLLGQPSYAGRDRDPCPVPWGRSPVDRVLRKAMAADPAQRYDTCGTLAEALASAARRTPYLRRMFWAAAAVVVCLAVLAGLTIFTDVTDPAPEETALARVPAALRADCRVLDASTMGAGSALSCQDSAGRGAVTELFDDGVAAAEAYARVVGDSRVARARGDCTKDPGAEHRYPATGPARGRVACYARGGLTILVWTDEAAGTVSRAEAPVADAVALRRSWLDWTGPDHAFPTADERALLDVAAGSECTRVPASDLDTYPAAVAGVSCVPRGAGARAVSYYRVPSLPDLRAGFAARVGDAKAPSGVPCATAPGFLGTARHDWLGVDVGQVLCRPGPDGTLVMDWSMEPLSIAGRVTGAEPAALAGWWSQWHLAPLGRVVEAINAHATPSFPTAAERALLDHIPPASRLNCVRPSRDQVWRDVGVEPVVGVACGRTSGAELVVYYQFRDATAMRTVYNGTTDSEAACTSLPAEFEGDRPYSRDGSTGRLRCATYPDTGERFLQWTDERLAIGVYARRASEPFAAIDWWTHDAGPI